MENKTKILILILAIIIGILLLAVGYAAIQNIELDISGDAQGSISNENFKIKFIEPVTVSNASNIEATITGDITGTIEVKNLSAKGDTETATYIIKNESKGLSADLSVSTTNDNPEYFTIKSELGQTSIKENEETTLKITVELSKTPIKDNIKANVGVLVKAMPVQPGQEGTSEDIKGEAQTPVAVTFPYLPTGFHQVEGTNLYKGLVIESEDKNQQYVWVEVPKTEEVYPTVGINLDLDSLTGNELATAFNNIVNDLNLYISGYDAYKNIDIYYSDELTGLTSVQYKELYQKMLKSVYENGGFYVGRYELGSTEVRSSVNPGKTTTAVVKQHAYPYTYITCKEGQELATDLVNGEQYTSSLMFGIQWDLMIKYLDTKGAAKKELKSDSSNWGNYRDNVWTIEGENFKWSLNPGSNSPTWNSGPRSKTAKFQQILLTTGASDEFSKQNIYDIAGNVTEWLLGHTKNDATPAVGRGSNFTANGVNFPAFSQWGYKMEQRADVGTRPVLF